MAEGHQYSVAVSEAECPICKVEVASIRILPCSHPFCDNCLIKLLEKSNDFLCPICRKICTKPEEAIRKFFGEMKCPLCFKSKDVDEFFWCVECRNLMCCRCIAKEHGFKHELLEWSTQKAYAACFQALSNSKNFKTEKVAKSIELLLKPIISEAVTLIENKFSVQKDVGRFLAQSYGLNIKSIGNGSTSESSPHTPNLMRTLSALAAVDLPIDPVDIGGPCNIRNPERLLQVLLEELEYSKDYRDPNSDKSVQASSEEPQEENKSLYPVTASSNSATNKGETFKFVWHKTNSFINTTNGSLEIGPFEQRLKTDLIIGPSNSYAVLESHRALFFIKGVNSENTNDWKVQSISSSSKTEIISASLDDIGGIHVIGLDGKKAQYFHGSSEGSTYSFAIHLNADIKGQIVDGKICSTDTGIPFLFIVAQQSSGYESYMYKFGTFKGSNPKQYEFATYAHKIPAAYIRSACAIRKAKHKQWILGADDDGIHVFFRQSSVLAAIRYIQIKSIQFLSFGSLVETATMCETCVKSNSDKNQKQTVLKLSPIDSGLIAPHQDIQNRENKVICSLGFQKKELKAYSFGSDGFFREIV